MLELIFQGLIEWIYGLVLEAWEYFFSVFMDVLSVDFDYLKTYMPVIPEIMKIMLAVGWALLVGNLVFQATKSMMTGLGFEGEDPKLLFTRSFVFAFLLVASPQICEIGLDITSKIIDLLKMTDAVDVELVDETAFGSMGAAWLLVIIVNIILMFKVIRMLLEIVEQYLVLSFLTICAPMAFGMGGSRNTSDIFTGWCRMFASMCFVIMSNMIFFKLLLSLLSNIPTGVDILLWIAMVFAVVKLAKKVDAIITRIGLNPAITGDGLGGRSLPGLLAYTVIRSMASNVVKAAGKSTGSPSGGSSGGGSGANANGGKPNFPGPSGGGAAASPSSSAKSGAGKNHTSSQSSTNSHSANNTAQQNTASQTSEQSTSQQPGGKSWTPSGQPVSVTPDDNEAVAMEGSAPVSYANTQAQSTNATTNAAADRKSSVPPGTVRSPSHVKPGGAKPAQKVNMNSVQANSTNTSRNTSVRPGQAMPGAAPGSNINSGKDGKPGVGAAGTGGTSGMRTGLGNGKAPQPGLAGTGAGSGVHEVPGKAGTSRPGMAGTVTAADALNPAMKGTMPQPGLAGNTPATDKGGASQPGAAGTGTVSGTRKTSVSGKTQRPGMAGIGTGSKVRAASGNGAGFRHSTAGNSTPSGNGAAPNEGKPALPGTAGTGGVSSEHSTHNSGQTAATRFTNAPRMAQHQAVQNSVQSAQQSAVTVESAKQMPAVSAGKGGPVSAPGTGISGGRDSRFSQRPATAQPAQSGTSPRPGTAGSAAGSQTSQPAQAAREPQRMGVGNGVVPPAVASAPGTAQQESRVSHQSNANAGNKSSAPSTPGSGKRTAPSGAPAQPKSRPVRTSGTGDLSKRAGSAPARQESRPQKQASPSMKEKMPPVRPGMAGTAPPAAHASRTEQAETRPPRPEETAPEVKENTNGAETVPAESEKEDGGDE